MTTAGSTTVEVVYNSSTAEFTGTYDVLDMVGTIVTYIVFIVEIVVVFAVVGIIFALLNKVGKT